MKLKSFSILGLDIGGANIKAALLQCQGQKVMTYSVAAKPFEIWQHPDKLSMLLQKLNRELGGGDVSKIAVTMTAELSDAFRTKREGVICILDAVKQAFKKSSIYPFGLDGSFLPLDNAYQTPLLCAASNWLASAQFLASVYPNCLLIDIGSTTTDIIPIQHGKVISQGRTDPQRLISGELVYSGILRTNPNTIVTHIPIGGRSCGVAAEYFTCMADVYLILGKISPESYSCPTPDGRAKTVLAAQERLARLICADCEILSEKELEKMACYIFEKQLQQITESLLLVLSSLQNNFDFSVALIGSGHFLTQEVVRRLGLSTIDRNQNDCPWPLTALPAYAVAYLLVQSKNTDFDD